VTVGGQCGSESLAARMLQLRHDTRLVRNDANMGALFRLGRPLSAVERRARIAIYSRSNALESRAGVWTGAFGSDEALAAMRHFLAERDRPVWFTLMLP